MPEIMTSAKKKSPVVKSKKGHKPEKMYPEYETICYFDSDGMTAEKMKSLIGWCTDLEEAEKAGVFHPTLTDLQGNKVWLLKNKGNRPFDYAHAMKLGQDMLTQHWKKNGECLSIGEYGNFLSGQHRGVGLILAQQRLEAADEKSHWKKLWKDGIVRIDMQVNYGIPEDDETKGTIDNVKARSLSDVLYGTGLFEGLVNPDGGGVIKPQHDKVLCRMMEHAVRTLWERTGAKKNPYSPYRTHSESLEFIADHPKLKECVQHVWTEYTGGDKWAVRNQRFPAGTLSGLVYLFSSSGTNENQKEKYHKSRKEKDLSLEFQDRAEEFVVLLCDETSEDLKDVRKLLGELSDGTTANSSISAEKTGILCKAWNLFKDEEPVKRTDIKVHRRANDHGVFIIDDQHIDVGGIDMGPYKLIETDEEPEADEVKAIAERLEAEKKKKQEKLAQKGQKDTPSKGKGKGKKSSPPVVEEDDESEGMNPVLSDEEEIEVEL